MHKNVHSSTIHKNSKLDTTQKPIKSTMDKYIEVQSHNWIPDSNEKKQSTTICSNTDVSQIYDIEQNKPDSKAHMVYCCCCYIYLKYKTMIQAFLKKQEKSQINNLTYDLKEKE